ncbi:NADPH cytochrome P450 oxidoreductase family protein [Uliginosibacterium paludis]|uniref:NADPH--hemoprotein reductase n=1 Tax=Uliginosibacterium paludis TaxID=1615952 RepID=A0ABV2CKW5_9RHOO
MNTFTLFGQEGWRLVGALALVLAYLALCARLYCRSHPGNLSCQSFMPVRRGSGQAPAVCIVYASQTGQAQAIAEQSARALASSDVPVRLYRFEQDWLAEAARASCVLFVVSTSGEGDAPDHAASAWRRLCASDAGLAGVRHGVLALGDRQYTRFCGFGRELDQWLASRGAAQAFERIELDRLDAVGLARWQAEVGRRGARVELPLAAQVVPSEDWRFIDRVHLNKGSAGAPMCRVRVAPAAGRAHWQAGDLLDVVIPGGDGHPRSYSIANCDTDGVVELIVRSHFREDGSAGEASAWLNERASADALLKAGVRHNPSFHLDASPQTPLILIGAGSGLAGLRSHLQARAKALADRQTAAPALSAWLVYGERSAAFDAMCSEEFDAMLSTGALSRLDRVFSRDTPDAPYVQHRLLTEQDRVRQWVEAGAIVLVCGSAGAMARGVDEALGRILGREQVAQLLEAGRIRRDVF